MVAHEGSTVVGTWGQINKTFTLVVYNERKMKSSKTSSMLIVKDF